MVVMRTKVRTGRSLRSDSENFVGVKKAETGVGYHNKLELETMLL